MQIEILARMIKIGNCFVMKCLMHTGFQNTLSKIHSASDFCLVTYFIVLLAYK